MNNSHESLAHCMAVVAIEVDLAKDGGGRAEWQTLDREGARRIGEAIAPDLARLLPGVEALGLTLAGALYDQTQLLAPGWPVFDELAELYLESLGGTPFKPPLPAANKPPLPAAKKPPLPSSAPQIGFTVRIQFCTLNRGQAVRRQIQPLQITAHTVSDAGTSTSSLPESFSSWTRSQPWHRIYSAQLA